MFKISQRAQMPTENYDVMDYKLIICAICEPKLISPQRETNPKPYWLHP